MQYFFLNAFKQYIEYIIFLYLKTPSYKKMFPQFQMIRDFDLYQQNFHQFSRFSAPVFHKDDFLKQTQDNELETDKITCFTRSLKTKRSSIETSFENNIISQHNLGFKKSLQKYVEKCYPSLIKVQSKCFTNEIFEIDEQVNFGEQKLKNLIIRDTKLYEQKEKKQFLTDLFYQEKLNEFLNNICNTVNPHIANELLFIANLFWQAYIPNQQLGMSETEITKLVDQLLDSQNGLKYLQKIEYLNFKKAIMVPQVDQNQLNEYFTTFLKQYGNTLLLVIEEYFKNPYCKDETENCCGKRLLNFRDLSNDQLSDAQNQDNYSLTHKKRKL